MPPTGHCLIIPPHSPERPKVVKSPNKVSTTREIQQQHVPPFDGPFVAGDERDAAFSRVSQVRTQIELTVVQRYRQGVKAVCCGVVYEIPGRVRNTVYRIVIRVGVKFDFEHPNKRMKVPCRWNASC